MEEKSGNSEGKRIKSMLRRRLILAILSAGIEPWERKSRVSDRFRPQYAKTAAYLEHVAVF